MDIYDAEWYEIDIMEFGQELVDEWYGDDVSFDDGGYIVWEDTPLETWDDLDQQMDIYDAEWYEIDIMEFGQELVDEWYGDDVSFDDGGYIVWEDTPLETWDDLDQQMDIYDEFVETYEFTEEVYLVSYDEFEHDPLPFDTSEELIEDFVFHETVLVEDYEDLDTYIEFETIEELDEWYEEELAQTEEEEEEFEDELIVEIEEETLEEEVVEELEEERLAEVEEEILEEREEERKGGITATQLNVVASTIQTASDSVAGTTAGTTVRTGGWGSSTGGTTSSSSVNYGSAGNK
jgi:hypothetical protein